MNHSPAPPIRAVIVTYHRPQQLRRTLDELRHQSRRAEETIVVDNDPGRGAALLVAAVGDTAVYLAPGENLGPAGGLRLGIDHALRDHFRGWVLCVDDDNHPPDRSTVEFLERRGGEARAADPRVGGIALSGARFDRRRSRLVRLADDDLEGIHDVDYLAGNQFPLYWSDALRDVGGHEPELFFGFEELDLGLRLRARDWRLLIDGDRLTELRRQHGRLERGGRVAHRSRPEIPWRRYYSTRNLVHISREHSSRTGTAVATVAPIARSLLVALRRRPESGALLSSSLRGVHDGWRGRMGRTVEPVVPSARPGPGGHE